MPSNNKPKQPFRHWLYGMTKSVALKLDTVRQIRENPYRLGRNDEIK